MGVITMLLDRTFYPVFRWEGRRARIFILNDLELLISHPSLSLSLSLSISYIHEVLRARADLPNTIRPLFEAS